MKYIVDVQFWNISKSKVVYRIMKAFWSCFNTDKNILSQRNLKIPNNKWLHFRSKSSKHTLILCMHEPPMWGTPSLGQLKTTGLKFITSSVWATAWTKTETNAWWKIRMSGPMFGPAAVVEEWQKPYQCDHFIVIQAAMRINYAKTTLIDVFSDTQQRKKELDPL